MITRDDMSMETRDIEMEVLKAAVPSAQNLTEDTLARILGSVSAMKLKGSTALKDHEEKKKREKEKQKYT